MLIVLPPSETKAAGGSGAPLNYDSLSFPSLNPVRSSLVSYLTSQSLDSLMAALGLSEKLRPEAASDLELLTSPTMPALSRYTGVLYDALDAATIPDHSCLAVGSALFGVLRADDPIPHYRLSGGTKLDGRTMRSWWGTSITEALTSLDDLIIDLRSGTYQQVGRVPDAVTVRVESVRDDGSRKVISHFNKHYKGLLARSLALSGAAPTSVAEVADLARSCGYTIEDNGTSELTLVV